MSRPTRVELATRTIFNLLGPMSNPAGAKRQLVGVFAARMGGADGRGAGPARRRARLGGARLGGMDELTTAGHEHGRRIQGRRGAQFEVAPEDAGLPRAPLDALKGGEPAHNAALMRGVLAGEKGPLRDIMLLNSAAGFIVAGRAANLYDGAALAAEIIDGGKAAAGAAAARCGDQSVSDVLTEICDRKRQHVKERKQAMPEATLRQRLSKAPAPRGFADALAAQAAAGRYGLIAEIKKASPSKGLIRADFDPPALALAYQARRRDLPVGADRRALFPG